MMAGGALSAAGSLNFGGLNGALGGGLNGALGDHAMTGVSSIKMQQLTQLLDGFSLAEFLFFDAEVGKTIGPVQGADGWFIVRVNSRTPARRKIDVKVERERELVREDYVTCRFFTWASGVIGKAKFE